MSESARSYDVVVVGSGPAGISAALNVERLAPDLAARTLVIEKERHPRHKLCGGGITVLSQQILSSLGLDLTLTFVPIHEILLRFEDRDVLIREENVIKIVRRERFDAALVAAARGRGIQIREGITFTTLRRESDCIVLETDQGEIRAKAVVAADGAKSTVRRHAGLEGPSRICRAVEILTPENPETNQGFRDHRGVFDFTAIEQGLQGYYWDFPSSVEGEPYMNRGLFDSRVLPQRPNADLKGIFQRHLSERGLNLHDFKLMGNPSRWFDPAAEFSAPRVLLTGDAAGIEPLGGDGISCSLWYGEVVAAELAAAFKSDDFSFSGYRGRLLAHPLGQHLKRRTRLARFLYGLRSRRALRAFWTYLNIRTRLTNPLFASHT
jgi:menaquinone-9 beta-reductase